MNLPTLAVLGGLAYVLRYVVRNQPPLGIAIGFALLGLAAYMASSFDVGDFRTEGSPAGAIMAVVYLCAGFGVIIAGFTVIFFSTRNLGGAPPPAASRARASREACPRAPRCRTRWTTA